MGRAKTTKNEIVIVCNPSSSVNLAQNLNPMAQSDILDLVKQRNPNEPEFLQAAEEVIASILPVLDKNPEYKKLKLLERMLEPERLITFRVTWLDDKGEVQVNRGFRVQMNSAIGPYKGGLRFHPSV